MKIIQVIKTEDNHMWQGALLGLGDDGVLYELNLRERVWYKLAEPLVAQEIDAK
jgi:hypothetical protein